ncbi:MAG: hypothetical protein RBR08_15705 [Desulforegulaceae bacterium]|jgi:hypothetical protein|nr:hypothetical protein [Desulforegulaceae bacterium]
MFEIKYLFEIQYTRANSNINRVYAIAKSEDDIERYAAKNELKIFFIKTLASNLGDPQAKGKDVSLLLEL